MQTTHAALAAAHAFGTPTVHPNLVVCAVPDEDALLSAFERLKEKGVPCCLWREEDLGDEATGVATAPLRGKARKVLKRYRLLGD